MFSTNILYVILHICSTTMYRRMLAVLLTESFKTGQKMGIADAAREAGSIVGYSDQTVRDLRKQSWDNEEMLDERRQQVRSNDGLQR